MNSKKLRKWNNVLHRDLGYFFVAMTLIYGISGIALNHIKDWNPNYIIERQEIVTKLSGTSQSITKADILTELERHDIEDEYKSHYFPNPNKLKIFIDDGTIDFEIQSGIAIYETIKRRPFFYEVNFLHYNPGGLWLWFSDIYCVSLIILAITGLFVLSGKKGIKGRGWKLALAGLIAPVLFLVFLL